jgi:hypothetical protein
VNIWSRIWRLKLGQLIQLSLLFISQPFLIGPTLTATKRTMVLCDELFGRAHHKSNKTNAFRHALWNILICHKTLKKTQNKDKSIVWTQKATSLYENVTDNGKMEKAMDLHNNKVGLNLFSTVFDKKEEEIISILEKMMGKSQKVTKFDDFIKFNQVLVHLE